MNERRDAPPVKRQSFAALRARLRRAYEIALGRRANPEFVLRIDSAHAYNRFTGTPPANRQLGDGIDEGRDSSRSGMGTRISEESLFVRSR